MKSHFEGCRVTDLFPHHEINGASRGCRVTDFFPKHDSKSAVPQVKGYPIRSVRSPLSNGLNCLNAKENCHEVTGLPVLHASLLYMTREKREKKISLAHIGLYFSKFGNSVTFSCNCPSLLANPGYRSVVTCGNRGNLGKSPRNHAADGRSLS